MEKATFVKVFLIPFLLMLFGKQFSNQFMCIRFKLNISISKVIICLPLQMLIIYYKKIVYVTNLFDDVNIGRRRKPRGNTMY